MRERLALVMLLALALRPAVGRGGRALRHRRRSAGHRRALRAALHVSYRDRRGSRRRDLGRVRLRGSARSGGPGHAPHHGGGPAAALAPDRPRRGCPGAHLVRGQRRRSGRTPGPRRDAGGGVPAAVAPCARPARSRPSPRSRSRRGARSPGSRSARTRRWPGCPADAQPVRRGSLVVTEVAVGPGLGRPEGVAVDRDGAAWVAEMAADTLVHVGRDGTVRRLPLPGGQPPPRRGGRARRARVGRPVRPPRAAGGDADHRRHAAVADAVRDTLASLGAGRRPGGRRVDERVHRQHRDVLRPGPRRFAAWVVPTRGSGVRALTVDRRGRAWFVGSGSGRLGVVGPPLPRDTMSAR